MTTKTSDKKQSSLREWLIVMLLMILVIAVGSIFPVVYSRMLQSAWSVTREMVFILPAVLILMGLFSVWVKKEMVEKYLGKAAGWRGIMLALFLGTLPTGPLYIAFPLAAGLRQKGASLSNISVFLTAWACIKIPQELLEIQFLGFRFMLVRLSLTILTAVIIGLIVERVIPAAEIPKDLTKEKIQ